MTPPTGEFTITLDAREAWIAAWFLKTTTSNPEAHRVAALINQRLNDDQRTG